MKKILYFIPAIIFCLLYGIAFIVWDLEPVAYVFCLLLVLSGIILCYNKWWGAVPGIVMGIWLMALDLSTNGPKIIIQWPFGLVIVIYFILCGIVSYKNKTINN